MIRTETLDYERHTTASLPRAQRRSAFRARLLAELRGLRQAHPGGEGPAAADLRAALSLWEHAHAEGLHLDWVEPLIAQGLAQVLVEEWGRKAALTASAARLQAAA